MTGGKEVDEEDDMFILVAPQNAVGNCIIDVRRILEMQEFVIHFIVSTSSLDLFVRIYKR